MRDYMIGFSAPDVLVMKSNTKEEKEEELVFGADEALTERGSLIDKNSFILEDHLAPQ